jgi:hypothetical protein
MKVSHGLLVTGFFGGAVLGAGAVPGTADPGGPLLSGTYSATAQYRAATAPAILHISSKCPGCDAVATGDNGKSVVLKWNGRTWTSAAGAEQPDGHRSELHERDDVPHPRGLWDRRARNLERNARRRLTGD